MVNYFVILLLVVTWFGVSIESVIINVDEVISGKSNKCGKDIKIREDNTVVVTLVSREHINYASCTNVMTNVIVSFSIARRRNPTGVFQGKDNLEGEWKCTFIINDTLVKTEGRVNGKNNYFNCSVSVKIQHNVKLTITNQASKEFVKATTNDLMYYFFTPDEKIDIECQKVTRDRKCNLQSGSLIVKLCYDDDVCFKQPQTDKSLITFFTNIYVNLTDSQLFCIYTSRLNETYTAQVVFRRIPGSNSNGTGQSQPASLRILELGEKTKELMSPNLIFQGKVGETKRYECTHNEKTGSIHWEICRNKFDMNCAPGEYLNYRVVETVTLKHNSNGTIVKCVYVNRYNIKKEIAIALYANNITNNKEISEIPHPTQNINYEANETYKAHVDQTWIYITIGVACAVIVGAVVCFMSKLIRKKTQYIEHVYESVIYDTRGQQPSTPSMEGATNLRQIRVSRDSAKYVTMTPGETPSVAHYLLPTRLNVTEQMRQLHQQDNNVTSESERYINVKPGNPPAVLRVSTGFGKPNNHVSNESDRYLTMQPGNLSTVSTAAKFDPLVASSSLTTSSIRTPTCLPSSDKALEEIIYEDCNEFYPNHFGEEYTYEEI